MFCIIDCNLGNLRNVQKAFERLGIRAGISSKKEELESAQAIILPGVGAFGDAIANLQALHLIESIREQVLHKKKPILGICLGMQLFGEESYERGHYRGLGLLPMSIQRLQPKEKLPVPHVGWDDITVKNNSSLLAGLPENPDFYFVHSFHAACNSPEIVAAMCDYGGEFVAAVQWGNIFATQFHPEKSQASGLKVLANFAKIVGEQKC